MRISLAKVLSAAHDLHRAITADLLKIAGVVCHDGYAFAPRCSGYQDIIGNPQAFFNRDTRYELCLVIAPASLE
jgi:hypothetical protein